MWRKGRGEPGIYAKKKSEKLLRVEGSGCIIPAGSPGVNPMERRPKGAEERVGRCLAANLGRPYAVSP